MRRTTTIAHLLATAAVAGLALTGTTAALAGPLGPPAGATSDLTVATTPDDPVDPGDEEPGEPEEPTEPGAGPGPASGIDDITSCLGQDAEGQPVDLCDHPDQPPVEPPVEPPVDPCEDVTGEPGTADLTIPAPSGDGEPLDLTAELADCETPGGGGDGGAPFTG